MKDTNKNQIPGARFKIPGAENPIVSPLDLGFVISGYETSFAE
jgi:hypothetical protein